jgi:hypothetical protein
MFADEVYEWLGKLRMRRAEQDVVAGAVTVAPLLGERLSRPEVPNPSELYELLAGRPVEVLIMAVLLAPDEALAEQRVRAYLERIRNVRLEISGKDLKKEGVPESPELGAVLRQTLALKLDGFVSGPEEELAAALRLLGRSSSS